jgi:Glycosyltransferase 61
VIELLEGFGFISLFIEDYDFAEQVALFRKAEAIVSPHSAALGGIIYTEELKLCVLYPEQRPAGYFYTLARGLGHRHYCVNSDVGEDDNFEVDLVALKQVLVEMELD